MKELIFHAFNLEMRLFPVESLLILTRVMHTKFYPVEAFIKPKDIFKKLNSLIATGNTFSSPLCRILLRALRAKVAMKRSYLNSINQTSQHYKIRNPIRTTQGVKLGLLDTLSWSQKKKKQKPQNIKSS